MSAKRQGWSMGYDNPISRVMCEDNHLIPAHVREALSTPPKGYLNITRNQQRSPDAASMFTTHIPSSRNDARLYLASMQYPYTRKEQLLRKAASAPLLSYGKMYAAFVTLTVSILVYAAYSDNARHAVSTIALCVALISASLVVAGTAYALVTAWADAYVDNRSDDYEPSAPTALMREIKERSIDVHCVDYRLAKLAWNVYCYDTEHYDELVELIRDMRDNPAERGTKTHRVYSEIIDTFCRASELRQAASRKTLADNAAAIEQQRSDAALYEDASRELADEMRANALEHTVLNRLRAEALATEDIYGDSE